MRLLVVEDESLLAQQIKEQLQQQQFSVDVATDGDDGWFKLSEYPYDLAIIDIGLPKMDGLTLIRKARQKALKTPIIVLTARGSWQEKVEGLDAGADDYLTKPFQRDELLRSVRARLDKAAGQRLAAQRLAEQTHNLAHFDAATRLPNRNHWQLLLSDLLSGLPPGPPQALALVVGLDNLPAGQWRYATATERF